MWSCESTARQVVNVYEQQVVEVYEQQVVEVWEVGGGWGEVASHRDKLPNLPNPFQLRLRSTYTGPRCGGAGTARPRHRSQTSRRACASIRFLRPARRT